MLVAASRRAIQGLMRSTATWRPLRYAASGALSSRYCLIRQAAATVDCRVGCGAAPVPSCPSRGHATRRPDGGPPGWHSVGCWHPLALPQQSSIPPPGPPLVRGLQAAAGHDGPRTLVLGAVVGLPYVILSRHKRFSS